MSVFVFVPFVHSSFCEGQIAAYIQEGLFDAGFIRPIIQDVHRFKNNSNANYHAIVEFLQLDDRARRMLEKKVLELYQKYSEQRKMILLPTTRKYKSTRSTPLSYELYPLKF